MSSRHTDIWLLQFSFATNKNAENHLTLECDEEKLYESMRLPSTITLILVFSSFYFIFATISVSLATPNENSVVWNQCSSEERRERESATMAACHFSLKLKNFFSLLIHVPLRSVCLTHGFDFPNKLFITVRTFYLNKNKND